jgi:hypothetical protein
MNHIKNGLAKIISQNCDNLGLISEQILSHCTECTKNQREFMSSNPSTRIPSNRENFPGFLDHATVILFRVGTFAVSFDKWMSMS